MRNIASYQEGYTDGYDDAKKKYERPKGEWIIVHDKYGESFECPFCSKQVCGTDLNFCVKCGASMKKGGAE